MEKKHMLSRGQSKYTTLFRFTSVALTRWALPLLMAIISLAGAARAEEAGVTATTIRIGGVMDLESDSKGRGMAMKAGIEAALKGEKIQGRAIEYIAVNDSFDRKLAVEASKQLIGQGVLLMLGNVSTLTAQATLPVLADNKIPAVGFYTGAAFLRPGVGDIVNFRASYDQETARVVEVALAGGVKPQQICVYTPNDKSGMSDLAGLKAVLAKHAGAEDTIKKLDEVLAVPADNPARNNIGPVGVYTRDTVQARDGYLSLKQWEKTVNMPCRLVVIFGGVYAPISNFIGYAHYKQEPWTYSVQSTVDVEKLREVLIGHRVTEKVIMTQIVPALDSPLPIVEEARKALGSELNYISLEGFIAGKMTLAILRSIKGDITRDNFLKAARGQKFDLGGLAIDFTNDNQGSDFVLLTSLQEGHFAPAQPPQLTKLFQ